jgi:hypothetical protein
MDFTTRHWIQLIVVLSLVIILIWLVYLAPRFFLTLPLVTHVLCIVSFPAPIPYPDFRNHFAGQECRRDFEISRTCCAAEVAEGTPG